MGSGAAGSGSEARADTAAGSCTPWSGCSITVIKGAGSGKIRVYERMRSTRIRQKLRQEQRRNEEWMARQFHDSCFSGLIRTRDF
jgi:hypothetical protein